jgi:hypothetical protein
VEPEGSLLCSGQPTPCPYPTAQKMIHLFRSMPQTRAKGLIDGIQDRQTEVEFNVLYDRKEY